MTIFIKWFQTFCKNITINTFTKRSLFNRKNIQVTYKNIFNKADNKMCTGILHAVK